MSKPTKPPKNAPDKPTGNVFARYVQQVSKVYKLPATVEKRLTDLTKYQAS